MKDKAPITVRMATVDDVELLHRFSVDLATFEDEPDAGSDSGEAADADSSQ